MIDPKTWTFRRLYRALREHNPRTLEAYLLEEALPFAKGEMHRFEPFRQRVGPPLEPEDRQGRLWDLYALSRINDFLLLAYQGSPLNAPLLPLDAYCQFFTGLGFETFSDLPFTPFHHEIVETQRSSHESVDIDVLHTFWPGLRLGELLFSRAGVRITTPDRFIIGWMAERTTLHFADVRLRRRAEDLGTGWGHNSQWRTDARLDYEDEERFWFNLDGPIDISGDTPVLRGPIKYSGDLSRTVEERRLVLAYRCLVQGKLSPDPFPYIDSLTTLKSDKFWLRSWSEPR